MQKWPEKQPKCYAARANHYQCARAKIATDSIKMLTESVKDLTESVKFLID